MDEYMFLFLIFNIVFLKGSINNNNNKKKSRKILFTTRITVFLNWNKWNEAKWSKNYKSEMMEF